MSGNGRPCLSLEDVTIYASLAGVRMVVGVFSVMMENEISKGRSSLPLVIYSCGVGACVFCPLAFFCDKDKQPKMSVSLSSQVLLISLNGVSAFQVLLFMGMSETSSTFVTAMTNLTLSIIFIMAWTLGLEKVDIKRAHSQFKIVGTLICVGGAMAMSFIPGPTLVQLTSWSSVTHSQSILQFVQEGNSGKRIKGCIYLLTAVTFLSYSMILQTKVLKKYPAPISIMAVTNLLGSMESAILIMVLDKGIHRASWILDWTGVVTVIYGGIVSHGLALALLLWGVQKRGPVFVGIFNLVTTLCSTILSSLFLGETLHVGSAIGMLLIFGGLYVVLWGKSKDHGIEEVLPHKEQPLNNAAVNYNPLLKILCLANV